LLAPEVRNSGIIVARMGTVALAAGESITLNLDGGHLTGITATPSAISALVENRSAVIAPGGLIILSAKAVDALQGGVVNNSGTLEATGLSSKGGRIVLEASTSVTNSGTINASAGADGSPAGRIEITAPEVTNGGTISAAGVASAAQAVAGGSIVVNATDITQSSTGKLDVSGLNGGNITLQLTSTSRMKQAHPPQPRSRARAARSPSTLCVTSRCRRPCWTHPASGQVVRSTSQAGVPRLLRILPASRRPWLYWERRKFAPRAGAGRAAASF
jgi:hypothetical protein